MGPWATELWRRRQWLRSVWRRSVARFLLHFKWGPLGRVFLVALISLARSCVFCIQLGLGALFLSPHLSPLSRWCNSLNAHPNQYMEDLSYLLSNWFWSSRLRSVSHQLNQGDEAETQAQEQRNATVKEIFDRLDVPGLSFSVCEHCIFMGFSKIYEILMPNNLFLFFLLSLSLSISIYVDNMSKIFWAWCLMRYCRGKKIWELSFESV